MEKGIVTSMWHTGQSCPVTTERVVTFQADGDELEVILNALHGSQRDKYKNPALVKQNKEY